ncbi:MAG: hypothetical protein ACE14L_01480 [Terriglobales bacterium]
MPLHVTVAIAASLLLLGLALALLRPRPQRKRRRVNHGYIPACYDQPPQEITNPKPQVPNRKTT